MSDFSFETIQDFDKHIGISIPNFPVLIDSIINISSYFLKGGRAYDIGCSTGLLLSKLASKYAGEFIGIDVSENLLGKNCDPGKANFIKADAAEFEYLDSDMFFSIFTLQFMSIDKREEVLRRSYKSISNGGAMIVSEKIYLESGYMQDIFSFSHYDLKRKNFSDQEIFEKQVSLRKIMNPLTEAENLKMFRKVGFKKIEPFWQSLLFKAWILTK